MYEEVWIFDDLWSIHTRRYDVSSDLIVLFLMIFPSFCSLKWSELEKKFFRSFSSLMTKNYRKIISQRETHEQTMPGQWIQFFTMFVFQEFSGNFSCTNYKKPRSAVALPWSWWSSPRLAATSRWPTCCVAVVFWSWSCAVPARCRWRWPSRRSANPAATTEWDTRQSSYFCSLKYFF